MKKIVFITFGLMAAIGLIYAIGQSFKKGTNITPKISGGDAISDDMIKKV